MRFPFGLAACKLQEWPFQSDLLLHLVGNKFWRLHNIMLFLKYDWKGKRQPTSINLVAKWQCKLIKCRSKLVLTWPYYQYTSTTQNNATRRHCLCILALISPQAIIDFDTFGVYAAKLPNSCISSKTSLLLLIHCFVPCQWKNSFKSGRNSATNCAVPSSRNVQTHSAPWICRSN